MAGTLSAWNSPHPIHLPLRSFPRELALCPLLKNFSLPILLALQNWHRTVSSLLVTVHFIWCGFYSSNVTMRRGASHVVNQACSMYSNRLVGAVMQVLSTWSVFMNDSCRHTCSSYTVSCRVTQENCLLHWVRLQMWSSVTSLFLWGLKKINPLFLSPLLLHMLEIYYPKTTIIVHFSSINITNISKLFTTKLYLYQPSNQMHLIYILFYVIHF